MFDFSRDAQANEDEAGRAGQLATDIHSTDADYDGGLADRAGKDKWGFLDEDFMEMNYAEEDEDVDQPEDTGRELRDDDEDED